MAVRPRTLLTLSLPPIESKPMASTTHESTNTANMSDHASETASRIMSSAAEMGQGAAKHYVQEPAKDLLSLAKSYAKDNPDVAACWAFGIGVFIGWKLKP